MIWGSDYEFGFCCSSRQISVFCVSFAEMDLRAQPEIVARAPSSTAAKPSFRAIEDRVAAYSMAVVALGDAGQWQEAVRKMDEMIRQGAALQEFACNSISHILNQKDSSLPS